MTAVGSVLRAWALVRAVLALAFGLGVAVYLSGCGGALAAQAQAASIAVVALEGAHRTIVATHEARSAACEDEPCVLRVREEMRPVEVAHDSVRATLVAWVQALELSRLATSGAELLPYMITSASRLLVEWHRLVLAFAGVGVALPDLPDSVLAAGGE